MYLHIFIFHESAIEKNDPLQPQCFDFAFPVFKAHTSENSSQSSKLFALLFPILLSHSGQLSS